VITAPFQFQRFAIAHDRCAMKVGTDGVLLGAWVSIDLKDSTAVRSRILDIGTGSGLIALMLAQRTEEYPVQITGIEIDELASAQAAENVAKSPWAASVQILNKSLNRFASEFVHEESAGSRFDLIVCNPPFFEGDHERPSQPRLMARHTGLLSRTELFASASCLLSDRGVIGLVLPSDQHKATLELAEAYQFYPRRITHVRPTPKHGYKRILVELSRFKISVMTSEIAIENERHKYTPEFDSLARDFYLRYAHPQ
jgi:tRNA1Val (adenine37-N6)-methyltransferase